MIKLDFDARRLGFLLGLGDLNREEPCMGYRNACVCPRCRERAAESPRKPAPQPWDVKAA